MFIEHYYAVNFLVEHEIRMTAYLISKDRGSSWEIIQVNTLGGTERVKPSDFVGVKLVKIDY